MDTLLILLVIALTAGLFIYLFWGLVKRLLVNSVVGIILIVLLNLVFTMNIPLDIFTVASVALFGLPAVGTMLMLHLGGWMPA